MVALRLGLVFALCSPMLSQTLQDRAGVATYYDGESELARSFQCIVERALGTDSGRAKRSANVRRGKKGSNQRELAKRRSHACQFKLRTMPSQRASLVQLMHERGRTGTMNVFCCLEGSLLSLTVGDEPTSHERGNHEMVMEDW